MTRFNIQWLQLRNFSFTARSPNSSFVGRWPSGTPRAGSAASGYFIQNSCLAVEMLNLASHLSAECAALSLHYVSMVA